MPSPELNSLFGFEASARPTANEFRGRYAAGELERLQQLGMEAQARGDTHMQAEIKIELPDGSARWLWLQAQAASPLEGGGPRVIGVVMDVTERRLSEERLSVVARELQHRVKNSLAVVQTLAHQSFRAGRSREDALVSFTERLKALGETTDVMTRNDWLDADLREIVQRVTQPYRDGQSDPFDVEGGHVPVASKPAIAIGMALHELCTNALKYGALSVPGGRVSIAWTSGADGVDIVWREVGGPAVERPAGRGFGTRLLERGLFNEREGKVHLDFDPSGVTCRISISGPNPA